MANVKITHVGADLTKAGLADFLKMDTVAATSTELVLTMHARIFGEKFKATNTFMGNDLTYDSADHFTGGTVTNWFLESTSDGRLFSSLAISDFSISAAKLFKLIKQDSADALFSRIFSGDDTFTTARTKGSSEVIVNGYGGDDSIEGSAGRDKLAGGAGDDGLSGGARKDALRGGEGNDTLRGGSGGDKFIFDAVLGSDNVDHILDFAAGIDAIILENQIFSGLAPGSLDPDVFVIGARAADSDDRVIYNADTGKLYFDHDGKGGDRQVLFAQMDAGLNLHDTDFQII